MTRIEVKPSGLDRLVPVPGKHRVYFAQDAWTPADDSYELRRLIDAGDLVERDAAPAPVAEPEMEH